MSQLSLLQMPATTLTKKNIRECALTVSDSKRIKISELLRTLIPFYVILHILNLANLLCFTEVSSWVSWNPQELLLPPRAISTASLSWGSIFSHFLLFASCTYIGNGGISGHGRNLDLLFFSFLYSRILRWSDLLCDIWDGFQVLSYRGRFDLCLQTSSERLGGSDLGTNGNGIFFTKYWLLKFSSLSVHRMMGVQFDRDPLECFLQCDKRVLMP